MNRKEYSQKLSEINQKYWDTKLELEKLNVPDSIIRQLNKIRQDLISELNRNCDDLMKLNNGEKIIIKK